MESRSGLKAIPTMIDPALHHGFDERVPSGRLWSLTAVGAGPAMVLPDLSLDLVWQGLEAMPTLTCRTIQAFCLTGDLGSRAVGIRFDPDVIRVDWNPNWAGWRDGLRDLNRRAPLLREAVQKGVVRVERSAGLSRLLEGLAQPSARVGSVSCDLGISERHLRRFCRTSIGLSPKETQRRLRLLRLATTAPGVPLGLLAVSSGFYDQAHASNEARELTGLSLGKLTRLRLADSSKSSR